MESRWCLPENNFLKSGEGISANNTRESFLRSHSDKLREKPLTSLAIILYKCLASLITNIHSLPKANKSSTNQQQSPDRDTKGARCHQNPISGRGVFERLRCGKAK
ncbi:hypothetical protein PoB_002387800 [Plakobranchus ocellatus]|uniref:Uncharacterized protein n=1 Tax=Plakobranchus ocellatus TaxID=259542 RepID=A0AAV3ZSF7_9GAST|nr:hypothetical protein PoB_002387800 [Plakobranchus ocellatus]